LQKGSAQDLDGTMGWARSRKRTTKFADRKLKRSTQKKRCTKGEAKRPSANGSPVQKEKRKKKETKRGGRRNERWDLSENGQVVH